MNFSFQVGMSDADHYLPLARAAEAAGFDGIYDSGQHLLPAGVQFQIPI